MEVIKIAYDKNFIKNFRQRIKPKKKLYNKYIFAIGLFLKNPEHPQLRSHNLKGRMLDYKSFWIDEDCRIIYKEEKDFYYFYDIGNHEQVYK